MNLLGGRKKKKLSFHDDLVEPTDAEFFDEYGKFTLSSWFAIIFILACLPPYCKSLIEVATTMSLDVEITCLIPNLINKMFWNLTAIRNLTMPEGGRICTYVDYNYSIFDNMDPAEAFEAKIILDGDMEARGEKIAVKTCTKKMVWSDYPFYNHSSNFLYSCYGSEFKEEAKLLGRFGTCTGYILIGALADIYGRKLLMVISIIISVIGIVLTPRANTFHKLLLANVIESFGFAGLQLLNYLLLLELCHKKYRSFLVLYMNFSETLAKITGYILKSYLMNCVQIYYLFSIPWFSLLFYAYYMPESPRWYLSYGKKKQAWKLLTSFGYLGPAPTFLPEINMNKFRILISNIEVMFTIKKYRRTVFIMTFLKFLKAIIIINVRRYVKIKNLSAVSHKFLVFMAETCSFLCVLPPFFLFGKFIALFYMIISGAICLFASIFVTHPRGWYVLNLLNAQYFYGLDLIINLYSAELLPTAIRGMGMGIIAGFGSLFAMVTRGTMRKSLAQRVVENIENIVFFVLQVMGIGLMTILPNIPVDELPDWKRYRNAMNT